MGVEQIKSLEKLDLIAIKKQIGISIPTDGKGIEIVEKPSGGNFLEKLEKVVWEILKQKPTEERIDLWLTPPAYWVKKREIEGIVEKTPGEERVVAKRHQFFLECFENETPTEEVVSKFSTTIEVIPHRKLAKVVVVKEFPREKKRKELLLALRARKTHTIIAKEWRVNGEKIKSKIVVVRHTT